MTSALLKALPAGPVTDAKLVELFSQLVEDERAKSTAPDGANIPMPKIERFVANGRKLAAAGSISDTTTDAARERGEVTATCAGSSNGSCYRLELRHEGDDPSFSCNCPYFTGAQNGFCKHIVALVIWHCKRLGEKARERECEEQRERKTKAGEKDEDGWFSRPAPRRSHEFSGGKSKSGASRGGSVAGADSGTGSGPTTVKPEQTGREKADEEAEASMDDIFDDWLGGDTRKEIDRRREQEEREEKERRERQAAEELKKESKKKVKGADSDSMDDLFDDWLGGGGAVGKEEKKEAEGLRAQTTTTTTTTTTATTGASVSRKEAGSDRRSDLLKDQKRQREPQEGSSQAASVSESPRRRKRAAASPLRTRAQPTAPPSVDVDSWREDLEERLTQSKRARKKAGGKVSFTAKFLKLGYKLKPSGE